MKPETERLLGTLELIAHNTFVWETEKQGEFNLWNLIISAGFVKETDIELVFEHWQNIELWGTPTSQIEGEYAPYREERKDDDWNESIANERQEYYQKLHILCKENLKNLKAYHLQFDKFFRYHPDFYVLMIVGETVNNNWICLAPTVKDLCFSRRDYTPFTLRDEASPCVPLGRDNNYSKTRDKIDDSVLSDIDSILNKISPITIYDYYHGGYNQTHQHQIVKGIATNKTDAIAIALQTSGMVVWELTQVEYAGNYNNNSHKLSQFMNQCLQDRTYCQISFWDRGYSYEFGKTPINDWDRHKV